MDLYNNVANNTGLILKHDLMSQMGILASKIAYHNFAWRYITLLMYSSGQAIGLQTFLMNYNQSVVVNTGSFAIRHRYIVPQFVIFGEDSSEISNMVTWLVESRYNRTGKFVIICASPDRECDERKVFKTLAKLFVVNVVLLKLSGESHEPLAYTYRIIVPGNCLNAEPEKIDLMTNCRNDACFTSVYPEKLTNFHRCHFTVSTVEQPPYMFLHNDTKKPFGTDGDILRFVATALNATLVLKTPRDEASVGYYVNNNWTGTFGDVYNQRALASVCSSPLTATKYGNFTISFPYSSIDVIWVARTALPKQPWKKLGNPLKFPVWIALLFMFIAIVSLDMFRRTIIWNKVRKVLKIGAPKRSLLFYSWIIFLGLPILHISKKRSFLTMVYIWIWFCFIMRNAYQAALFNSLKQKSCEGNFEDFNQVFQSGYPYGGTANLKEYYSEDREIYKNWINVKPEDFSVNLDSISNGSSSFVMAENKEVIKYYIKVNNSKKGFHVIPRKIVNSPTVMYFNKYSFWTNPVNSILRMASESGIIERVYRKYHKSGTPLRQEQTAEPLKLMHFTGAFVFLMLGIIISTISFVIEVICGILKNK